ncbi:MAG: Serine/threonine kinase, partial [Deltaproteobacteria bacterium]|nr:Serine/threonine kinase [Deltaproteobacteria bacterium]
MDCIAEDLLLQFVDGKLAPASAALVTEHIAGCASCRDRITGVDVTHHPGPKIDAFEATLTSLPVAPAIADLATRSPRGAVIGRYVIANVLGQGGMGVVYAAKDPKLDRNVALKVLHPTAGGEASARLQREGRAIARLAHPNVVTVFDVATHDDTVFIAMELVAGGSL